MAGDGGMTDTVHDDALETAARWRDADKDVALATVVSTRGSSPRPVGSQMAVDGTDPEVIEWRFPVLLDEFSIRRGSGGAGRHRGGDGVIRRVRFKAPMTAAILSGHRRVPPFGVGGGAPGEPGRNWVERADGSRVELTGCDQVEMGAGDVFVIATPGGGGFGAPPPEQDSP